MLVYFEISNHFVIILAKHSFVLLLKDNRENIMYEMYGCLDLQWV